MKKTSTIKRSTVSKFKFSDLAIFYIKANLFERSLADAIATVNNNNKTNIINNKHYSVLTHMTLWMCSSKVKKCLTSIHIFTLENLITT